MSSVYFAVPWNDQGVKLTDIFEFCDKDKDNVINVQELQRLVDVTSDEAIGAEEARALMTRVGGSIWQGLTPLQLWRFYQSGNATSSIDDDHAKIQAYMDQQHQLLLLMQLEDALQRYIAGATESKEDMVLG